MTDSIDSPPDLSRAASGSEDEAQGPSLRMCVYPGCKQPRHLDFVNYCFEHGTVLGVAASAPKKKKKPLSKSQSRIPSRKDKDRPGTAGSAKHARNPSRASAKNKIAKPAAAGPSYMNPTRSSRRKSSGAPKKAEESPAPAPAPAAAAAPAPAALSADQPTSEQLDAQGVGSGGDSGGDTPGSALDPQSAASSRASLAHFQKRQQALNENRRRREARRAGSISEYSDQLSENGEDRLPRPGESSSVFSRLAASGNFTGVMKKKREEQKRMAAQKPKETVPVSSTDESPEVFQRLTHQSSFTGVMKAQLLEQERIRREEERARRRAERLAAGEPDMPNIFKRLTDESNYTGAVRRKLEEKQHEHAEAPLKVSGRLPSVFARLTQSDSYTGLARRLHEQRKGSGSSTSRSYSSGYSNRSASSFASSLHSRDTAMNSIGSAGAAPLGMAEDQVTQLIEDFVVVLTSPNPEANPMGPIGFALARLKAALSEDDLSGWREAMTTMVDRHIAACRRDVNDDKCVKLSRDTSPSARSLLEALNLHSGGVRLDKKIGEAFRSRVLGESLLFPGTRSGRHPINAAELTQRVFSGQDFKTLNDTTPGSVGIFMLDIGGRKFVARATPDKPAGTRLCAFVRAAFFNGTDNSSRFELCQALRTTPVDQWHGRMVETVLADDTEMDLVEQVKIFEFGTQWPYGLNTHVNPHLARLLHAAPSRAPAPAADPQAQAQAASAAKESSMALTAAGRAQLEMQARELEAAREQIERLNAQLKRRESRGGGGDSMSEEKIQPIPEDA